MNIYQHIYQNNTDLLERVEKLNAKSVTMQYLKNEDVLLLRIGMSTSSYDSIDIDDLMTVHFEPETYKITGFTIPYVKEFTESLHALLKVKEEKERLIHETPKAQAVASAGLFGLATAY